MLCPDCGKEILEGQAFCHHCGRRLSVEVAEPAPDAGWRKKTPWEDRHGQGFFRGLFKTLRDALFSPTEFFHTMPVSGGLTDPLLYALIIGMTGLMFSYLWQILFQSMIWDALPPGMMGAYPHDILHGLGAGVGIAVLAVFSPIVIIFGLFLWAGILHLFLMMIGGARAGFEATFRAAAYSYSANILFAIPFCGGFIAPIWSIVLSIVGLKEAHEISGGKAVFAALFPLVICCGAIVIFVMLFMGAVAASFGTMMHMPR